MNRLFLILFSIVLASSSFADDTVYVQVRSSKVRSAAQLWAPAVSPVSYGDKLTKIKESGTWLEVKTAKGSGYIPISAVTKRPVVLGKAGIGKGAAPDAKDVVMAGKGFNHEVEKQFASVGAVNFKAVDAMEQIRVSDATLRGFVQAGKLGGQG